VRAAVADLGGEILGEDLRPFDVTRRRRSASRPSAPARGPR
jgi:hypothetical protein